jgi:hypothetical protein
MARTFGLVLVNCAVVVDEAEFVFCCEELQPAHPSASAKRAALPIWKVFPEKPLNMSNLSAR